MNLREKLLAIGVGTLAVLWIGTTGVSKFQDARDQNFRTLKKVRKDLVKADEADKQGREAQRKIKAWAEQSLPTDLDVAKSQYEGWLRERLIESGLIVNELHDKSSGGGSKRFQEISFLVDVEGSLAQLSNFLYQFYSAGHLHRISSTDLSPSREGDGTLDISMTIDALSLDDCERTETLSDRVSELPLPPLEEMRQAIVSRNIFAVYQPAVPVDTTASEQAAFELDSLLAQARFTGMIRGQGGWQMTIKMEDSGDILFFREGDPIEIGQFVGQIAKLDNRQAVVTLKNRQVSLRLGQYLSQAQTLADQAG